MTNSSSTPAAKGVTSTLNEALGIGQAAREYTSTADTGRVPSGLRMNGTHSGQSGFTVEFHVDIAVARCDEVAIAHPYMVAASGNQFLVKIQDATLLALAVRSNRSLSGPTAQLQ
jgi:hypothetical protein